MVLIYYMSIAALARVGCENSCSDNDSDGCPNVCDGWARAGYCVSGEIVAWMLKNCEKSCGLCTNCVPPNATGQEAKCNCDQGNPVQCMTNNTGCRVPCCSNTRCNARRPMITQTYEKSATCESEAGHPVYFPNLCEEFGYDFEGFNGAMCSLYDNTPDNVVTYDGLLKAIEGVLPSYNITYYNEATISTPAELCITVFPQSLLIINAPSKQVPTLSPTKPPTKTPTKTPTKFP